jgi:hypothetical protein
MPANHPSNWKWNVNKGYGELETTSLLLFSTVKIGFSSSHELLILGISVRIFLMQWFPLALCIIVFRHTVGLLWTSDQPVSEASTYTGQHSIETQETNIHALSEIRTRDPSNQAAAGLRLRPRGYRGRHSVCMEPNAVLPKRLVAEKPVGLKSYLLC